MRLGTVLALVLCLPTAAAAAWAVAVAVGERLGARPFAAAPSRNIAEAAAAADVATMVRMFRAGADPTRVYAVSPDLISSQILQVTGLEAAMWARRIELIRLLDREGAIVGPRQREELACLAFDLDMPDVVEYLAPGHTCERGATVARIVARSRADGGTQHE